MVRRLDSEDFVVHPSRVMRCRVAEIANLTHDILRLRLEIVAGGPFTFSAGQYAQLELPVAPGIRARLLDGKSSGPGVARISRAGDARWIGEPSHVPPRSRSATWSRYPGRWVLRICGLGIPGPMLCIAGGSGLAPVKCHSRDGTRLPDLTQPVHLYFGVRAERDVYFERELEELQKSHRHFSAHIVLSEPGATSPRVHSCRAGSDS